MELIPGSHATRSYPYIKALTFMDSAISITIKPYDILVFHSCLLHRGIFTSKQPHRRLLQVFEVYTSKEQLIYEVPHTLHIPGDETHSSFMITISKHNNIFSKLFHYAGYLNAATGYSSSRPRCVPSHIVYLSSEGLRGRLEVVPNTWQPINKYIINTSVDAKLLHTDCASAVNYKCYTQQFILYTIALIAIIVLIVWILFQCTQSYYDHTKLLRTHKGIVRRPARKGRAKK